MRREPRREWEHSTPGASARQPQSASKPITIHPSEEERVALIIVIRTPGAAHGHKARSQLLTARQRLARFIGSVEVRKGDSQAIEHVGVVWCDSDRSLGEFERLLVFALDD
jgi:hypothetical protein